MHQLSSPLGAVITWTSSQTCCLHSRPDVRRSVLVCCWDYDTHSQQWKISAATPFSFGCIAQGDWYFGQIYWPPYPFHYYVKSHDRTGMLKSSAKTCAWNVHFFFLNIGRHVDPWPNSSKIKWSCAVCEGWHGSGFIGLSLSKGIVLCECVCTRVSVCWFINLLSAEQTGSQRPNKTFERSTETTWQNSKPWPNSCIYCQCSCYQLMAWCWQNRLVSSQVDSPFLRNVKCMRSKVIGVLNGCAK